MSRIGPKQAELFDSYVTIWRRFKPVVFPTLTTKKALEIVNAAKLRGLSGQAKINPSLTREKAYEILSKTLNPETPDKLIGHLHAHNIVREFGSDYLKAIK